MTIIEVMESIKFNTGAKTMSWFVIPNNVHYRSEMVYITTRVATHKTKSGTVTITVSMTRDTWLHMPHGRSFKFTRTFSPGHDRYLIEVDR